jgi:hypothetical protein
LGKHEIPVNKSPAAPNVWSAAWPPDAMLPFAMPMPSVELKAMA